MIRQLIEGIRNQQYYNAKRRVGVVGPNTNVILEESDSAVNWWQAHYHQEITWVPFVGAPGDYKFVTTIETKFARTTIETPFKIVADTGGAPTHRWMRTGPVHGYIKGISD
jgi:hypothetical protein